MTLAPLFDKVLLRAEAPQAKALYRQISKSCEDVSLVEDASGDLVAA